MGGNYLHTARPDGTTLTGAIYDADHQNHINNLTPDGCDDYCFNVTQMQAVTDPGEVGSESLAISLAGDISRLRFVIKEMKGTTQWYESLRTKTIYPAFMPISTQGGIWTWRDAQNDILMVFFSVPDDYASGDLTVKLTRRASAAPGATTAVMTRTLTRFRDNSATSVLDNVVGMNFTPADANSHIFSHTIAAANFTAGDMFRVDYQRFGFDPGDTMTVAVVFDSSRVDYTGYAGR